MKMERNEYSAGAVKLSFWFPEFRKVVTLLNDGIAIDEIKQLNREQNIFGTQTARRAEQEFNTVSARIAALDSSFFPLFMDSDISTQKLIALSAVMAYDTLFFDFVFEVIREKIMVGSHELADSDVRVFFRNKQLQSDRVASWTDGTFVRLGRSYKTMLHEAGVLEKSKSGWTIKKPLFDSRLERWLKDYGYSPIVNALTGVR